MSQCGTSVTALSKKTPVSMEDIPHALHGQAQAACTGGGRNGGT